MKQRRLLLICFVAFFATTADAKNARNKNWEVSTIRPGGYCQYREVYLCYGSGRKQYHVANLSESVEDMLYVRTDEAVVGITVYDVRGVEVAAARSGQIELSHLPAGVYILKLCTASHTKTLRVFKKKP